MRPISLSLALLLACSSTSTPNPVVDAAADTAKTDGPTCACRDTFNLDKTSRGDTVGLEWLAWKYVPTCSFDADTIDVGTDSRFFAVFADTNGLPGAQLTADVPSSPAPNPSGFRRATLASLGLTAGTPVWVAIKSNPGGIDATLAPFATDGTKTNYTAGGPGSWLTPDSTAAVQSEVRGKCP
ncbi:hypothetical protein BH09MYX1_BH09MYX1_44160 [soil metagenome]